MINIPEVGQQINQELFTPTFQDNEINRTLINRIKIIYGKNITSNLVKRGPNRPLNWEQIMAKIPNRGFPRVDANIIDICYKAFYWSTDETRKTFLTTHPNFNLADLITFTQGCLPPSTASSGNIITIPHKKRPLAQDLIPSALKKKPRQFSHKELIHKQEELSALEKEKISNQEQIGLFEASRNDASAHKVEVSTPEGTPLPQFYGHYFCDSLAILMMSKILCDCF